MKRKIICISIVSMFLLMSFGYISIPAKKIQNNQNGLPDIEINYLYCWRNSKLDIISIEGEIENIGEYYVHETNIKVDVTFFAENSEEPFFITIVPYPYDGRGSSIWMNGEKIYFYGICRFQPSSITAHVDYSNNIIESNEDNNCFNKEVTEEILISGNVYYIDGGIEKPVYPANANYKITEFNRIYSGLDKLGNYIISIPPKEPLDQAHRYTIGIGGTYKCKYQEKTTEEYLLPEDSTTLDFVLEKKARSKNQLPLDFINKLLTNFPLLQHILSLPASQ